MLFYNELTSLFTGNYWRSIENRRKFATEFAAQKGFDPLVPANWDKVTKEDFIKQVIYSAVYYKRYMLLF